MSRTGGGLSFSAPGPLERKVESCSNISPPPSDWGAARVASYFREYHNYVVQTLTVHEAMSGHYLQAMQGHQFIAPTKVRAIFRSGTFGEGCDVDAEQVMAEQGSGGAVVSMQLLS